MSPIALGIGVAPSFRAPTIFIGLRVIAVTFRGVVDVVQWQPRKSRRAPVAGAAPHAVPASHRSSAHEPPTRQA